MASGRRATRLRFPPSSLPPRRSSSIRSTFPASAICVVRREGMNACRRSSMIASFAALPAAAAVDVPERGEGLRLVTVAMMRPGAKLASLPTSCRRVGGSPQGLGARDRGRRLGPRRGRRRLCALRLVADSPRGLPGRGACGAAWLRASDIFVWPAIDEAFGMAFIEAQACGLPRDRWQRRRRGERGCRRTHGSSGAVGRCRRVCAGDRPPHD